MLQRILVTLRLLLVASLLAACGEKIQPVAPSPLAVHVHAAPSATPASPLAALAAEDRPTVPTPLPGLAPTILLPNPDTSDQVRDPHVSHFSAVVSAEPHFDPRAGDRFPQFSVPLLDTLSSLFPYAGLAQADDTPPWESAPVTLYFPLLFRGITRLEQANALYDCPKAEYYLHVPDCTVLLLFYLDTNGPRWKEQRGWLKPNTHPCQWSGIICDNRRVRVVQVESNQMSGVLPPEIGQLNLTFLLVRNNQLIGPVPDSIAQLRDLESLDLRENQFTGRLHPRIPRLPRLRSLEFDTAKLAFNTDLFTCDDVGFGLVPRSDCQALVDIYRLTGGEKWQVTTVYTPPPTGPGHLYADKWLVGGNPCYWKGVNCVEKHVDILNLGNSNVKGRVPPAFGRLTSLGQLDLSHNYLYGPLPVEFRNLTQLLHLRLAGNRMPPDATGADQTLLCIPASIFPALEDAVNQEDMPPGGFCP